MHGPYEMFEGEMKISIILSLSQISLVHVLGSGLEGK